MFEIKKKKELKVEMHQISMPHCKIYEVLLSLDNSVAIFLLFWSGQNRKMMKTINMSLICYSSILIMLMLIYMWWWVFPEKISKEI